MARNALVDAITMFDSALKLKHDANALNDLGLAQRRLGDDVKGLLTFVQAMDALEDPWHPWHPWVDTAMFVPANAVASLTAGADIPSDLLRAALRHPVLQHGRSLFPFVAVLAEYSSYLHFDWSALPPEGSVESTLVFAINAHLAPPDANATDQWVQETGWQPLQRWLSAAPSALLDPTLEAVAAVNHKNAIHLSTQQASQAFELAYVPLPPALRWLAAAVQWTDPKHHLFQPLLSAPRWYTSVPSSGNSKTVQPALCPLLRLVFTSGDFRRHVIGWMVHGLFHSFNRSRVHTTTLQYGPLGGADTFQKEFALLPGIPDPDFSTGACVSYQHLLQKEGTQHLDAAVASSFCDARQWTHAGRLADAVDSFKVPGTWRTPSGYCRALLPSEACESMSNIPDAIADIFHDLATVTRPHFLVDLAGLTTGNIPAVNRGRPAPILVHYLSGPETIGNPVHADWKLVDQHVMPPDLATWQPTRPAVGRLWCSTDSMRRRYPGKCALHVYTEALAYIPASFQANTYPHAKDICDSRHRLGEHGPHNQISTCHPLATSPACAPSKGWCSNKRIVLLAFHATFKILPSTWLAWMNMLRSLPLSVLYITTRATRPKVPARMRRVAQALGIHHSRLIVLPERARELHYRVVHCGSLFLDAGYYGAHSTGADALRFGVPVLTLAGNNFGSRVVASLQSSWSLGQEVWRVGAVTTVSSWLEGEQVFVSLLLSHPRQAQRHDLISAQSSRPNQMKRRMWTSASYPTHRTASSPFDHVSLARRFERALRVMWDARRAAQSTGPGYDIVNDGWNGTSWDVGRTKRDFHVVVAPE